MKPHGPDFLHFAKGSYVHELLHYYYELVKSGFMVGDPILVVSIKDRIMNDLQELGEGADFGFFNDVSRTVVNYVEHRSPIIDSDIERFQIENHLQWSYDGRNFHGFADLIYWDKVKKCWVIRDHKTGTRNTHTLQSVKRNGQLLFYGTLFYKMTGNVAEVEINFANSSPPLKPGKTVIFNTIRVQHSETVYKNFWRYLCETHEAQKNLKPLRNLFACGNCPYFLICESELKDLSSDLIIRSRYKRAIVEVQSENSSESDQN